MNVIESIDAIVSPEGSLEVLSQREVEDLCDSSVGGLYEPFRRCCLAVLNSGSHVDDTRAVLAANPGFDVKLVQTENGVRIEIRNAPARAFVDGKMIRGIREHLFSVLRDIVYIDNEMMRGAIFTGRPKLTAITEQNFMKSRRDIPLSSSMPKSACFLFISPSLYWVELRFFSGLNTSKS